MATSEKQVIVAGFDDSEHSIYALDWILKHFFAPFASNPIYRLVLVHAKPSLPAVVPAVGSGILPYTEADMQKIAARIAKKAEEMGGSELANNVMVEVMQGDAKNILCEVVEKHQASMLVVGSHGYGAIKRAVLGSVSDYCVHHAHCTVMIVKRPKTEH